MVNPFANPFSHFEETLHPRSLRGTSEGGRFVAKPKAPKPVRRKKALAPPKPKAAKKARAAKVAGPRKAAAVTKAKAVKKAAKKAPAKKAAKKAITPHPPGTGPAPMNYSADEARDALTPKPRRLSDFLPIDPGSEARGDWEVNKAFAGDEATLREVYDAAVEKNRLAAIAEPDVSKALKAVVAEQGGELVYFQHKLKTDFSLFRKIQDEMVDRNKNAHDAATDNVRDSLRYTAIVPDDDYWAAGDRIGEALVAAGFVRVKETKGWAQKGYRGRNDTFKGADGIEFEVQTHTKDSKRISGINHTNYKEERADRNSAEVQQHYRDIQQPLWDSVKIPDGTPILDNDKDRKLIGLMGSGDTPSQEISAAHEKERSVRTEDFGMEYSKDNEAVVEKARTVPDDKWNELPVETLPARATTAAGTSVKLKANEETVKARHIDKVVSGQQPFREGYVTKLWRDDKGDLHIVDGHTRTAMYHALGKDMPVRIMDEASYKKLTAETGDATKAKVADATKLAAGKPTNAARDAQLAAYMASDQTAMRTPLPSRPRAEPKPDSAAAKTRAATDPARIHANALALMNETDQDVIDEGIDWYPDTQESIAEWVKGTDVSEMKGEAVAAALSPRVSWAENAIDAENVIQGRPPRTGIMDANLERATRIMAADGDDEAAILAALRGDSAPNSAYYDNTPKITNFYHNLHGNHDRMTMDTWMGKAGRLHPDERRKLINDDILARNAKVKSPKPVEKLKLLGPGDRPSEHQAGVAEKQADLANAAAEAAGQPAPYMPSGSLMLEHGYDQMESGYRSAVGEWNTTNPDRALLPDEFQAVQWIWIRGDAR